MSGITAKQQFHGTVALAILHLRRLAKSNDVDKGFAAARDLRMINPQHEAFMRDCLALDEQLQNGIEPATPITVDLSKELQECVLRINSADPA